MQRPSDEVMQILDFNKSLLGEPRFDDIDKNFYQKLKIALDMEDFENYLWLWEQPKRWFGSTFRKHLRQ